MTTRRSDPVQIVLARIAEVRAFALAQPESDITVMPAVRLRAAEQEAMRAAIVAYQPEARDEYRAHLAAILARVHSPHRHTCALAGWLEVNAADAALKHAAKAA